METTTKTKRKVSLGIKIASILTCVALLSVGFASWLILQPVTAETESGSFTVYTVQENNITITGAAVRNKNTIRFGTPTSPETFTNPWLRASSDVLVDVLEAEFNFTFTSNNLALKEAVDNLVVTVAGGTNFDAAVTAGYLEPVAIVATVGGAGTNVTVSNGVVTYDIPDSDTNKEIVLNVKMTFAWGDVTGNENPYNFYGDKAYDGKPNEDSTTTYAQEANSLLTAVAAIDDPATEGGAATGFTLTAEATND